jgi:hypothetical protein
MGAPTQFFNVDEVKKDHMYRYKLWHALDDWIRYTNDWMNDDFKNIDTKAISALAEKFTKISRECERNLPHDSSAVQGLKKLVGDFRETMPIVEAFGCHDLKSYHWDEIRLKI